MQTIYKYPLEIADRQIVVLPDGAEIRLVGCDPNGEPCIWAQVDSEEEVHNHRVFWLYGTGHPIAVNFPPPDTVQSENPLLEHRGSFLQRQFVWHLYEEV